MTEEQVFLAALDLADPADRAAYLEKACGGDVELRRRVEELLAAHFKPGTFLDEPLGRQLEPGPTIRQANPPGDAAAGGQKAEEGPAELHFLRPSCRADSLGRIGHYEVLQVLGKGGFGPRRLVVLVTGVLPLCFPTIRPPRPTLLRPRLSCAT